MLKQKRSNLQEMEVVISDPELISDKSHADHRRGSVFASFFMLLALAAVLTGSFVSAFHVPVSWLLLLPGMALLGAFFTWFMLERRLDGFARLLASLFLTVLYGAVCFVLQAEIQNGFYGTANAVIRVVNQAYGGNLGMFSSGTRMQITVFLLVIETPVLALLGAGLVRRCRFLPVLAALFPVLALIFVAGGSPADVCLLLILFALVMILAASRSRLTGWKTAFFAGLLVFCVSVPSWYLVRPLLGIPAAGAAKAGTRLETRLLQSLWQILPRISGGNLKLSLEGVGGGVEDGTLGAVDGYYFTGVETLRVTSAQKPQETVYLKGYIGEEYTGTSYEQGDEKNFANAASSWHTEGNASLYIQNLPFLRMMYYENFTEEETEMPEIPAGELKTTANTITVENLNANPGYTYVPYYAFLNDNYQIYGGDGCTGGQTVQEDIFSCYWRSSYKETMEAMRDTDDTEGVLNRAEASYQAYCEQHDLQVPEEGLERLKKECAAVAEKENWNRQTNRTKQPSWAVADEIEEIRLHVVKTLLTTCAYEMDVDALPEGEDFIEHFLYDAQEGYSMHFAAAATMLFRMYGVPARYVVGYVAPRELFSRNDDGTYTAILEDDNAHAWTEIYQPFLGWVPVEVTPGMETELSGDIYTEETEPQTQEQEETGAELAGKENKGTGFFHWLRFSSGMNLDTVMTAALVLLAVGGIIWVTARMRQRRRYRLGLGEAPDGQIRALYRSVYHLLVLAGMPEEYTAADGQVTDWLCGACPAFSTDDAARLQSMVLEANFGRGRLTGEDAQWMLGVYRTVKKSMGKLKKQG